MITLEVIDGINTVNFSDAPDGVRVNLLARTATGFGSDTLVPITNVVGSLRDDVIIGNGQDNRLDGQSAAT